MWSSVKVFCLFLVSVLLLSPQAKKQKSLVVNNLNDVKELKQALKKSTNILTLYINEPEAAVTITEVFNTASLLLKGQATLMALNCNTMNGKKLCKRMKVPSDKSYYIKHYTDGQYHKDYDRAESVSALVNFLKDPTGELPWDEDPAAIDIFHLKDYEGLLTFFKRGEGAYKKSLIMFYAPWCGYCKILKPEFLAAAADLKGVALLAALDASRPGNSKIRQDYNITGFPTLLYFERGQYKFPYNGEHKHSEIVEFVKNPSLQMQKKNQQLDEWTKEQSDVVHLTAENFAETLETVKHALVAFYAPWCGHCKKLKPEYEKAASNLKNMGVEGILAAVDGTKETDLTARFGVKAYPTLKYFNNGVYKFDASHVRHENQIVEFLKDPKEPPPPPPPETPWTDEESAVRHLDGDSFRKTLRRIRHAIVMFYAPWCGHCKSTKPEFVKAAEQFADELVVAFGAVDCTAEQALCSEQDIKGYPTIKYFSYYDKMVKDYNGGRKENDFILFIRNQMSTMESDKSVNKKNQESGFGDDVQLATDDDFEKIIGSSNPTFVMFYATWCEHCTTAKPAFSKLATLMKSDRKPVGMVAVDAAENSKVADLAGIQNLPTFKLYVSGKFVADYTGDRSYEDMLKFINNNRLRDEL